MTSDDFLINDAYNRVWCAPEQDRQFRFCPARISKPIGVRGSVDLLWTRYELPTQGEWYHVYQVGPIIYENLGLNLTDYVWTAASVEMVNQDLIIDVYTEGGRMVPRERVYLLATPDGNLNIAVKATTQIGDFGSEKLYFRFYSNAYFNREDEDDAQEGIEYRFVIPTTTDSISSISRVWRDIQMKSGKCFAFINGWKVQSINTATVKRGDLVEIVRDSSIREILEFEVRSLPLFLSTLDAKQKYLIHRPKNGDDLIEYRDDQDIFLINRANVNTYKGVYFHKNAEDSMRMVTHRDYSIPTAYVERFSSSNPDLGLSNVLTVQLILRHSGMDKLLIDEAHHIRELYKLSENDWMEAVIGTDANVDVWKAASLEESMYTALMRAYAGKVTRTMVEQAYGYNAISKLLADTPQIITDVNRWVELPFGLRGESTVYEYDAAGLLIDWHPNVNVQWYVARNQNARYVEAFIGKGGKTTSTIYGEDGPVPAGINYRLYTCPIVNGIPDGNWKDVTGDTTKYNIVGGQIVWSVNRKQTFTAIKMDDSFLTYDLTLNYPDGLLRFSLNIDEIRHEGALLTNLVEIPVGLLEIWLNGHPLIENLDWFMVGKEICIVNKVWRNRDTTANRITVRGSGFCNSDMSRIKQEEFGFVEQGYLSRNNRWNLRDDKVVRVTAAGRLYSTSELNWTEDRPGVMLPGVANGAPYQVLEPVIPLRGATLEDTYAMRALAQATDEQIENFMTEKMGEVVLDGPNIIPGPHVLYSPFISKIMHDLDAGYIPESEIDNAQYNDAHVKSLCADYEWLLPYEPTAKFVNNDYINVHPHESYETFVLGLYQYNFLRRVVKIYLKDKVNISPFISIRPLS
jgi:hypothetical protein